ncbi:MAG TPA: outer membrane lipoprotein-sorting protein [Candidatus Acidoferrum sp.]|nr:outer membrane lipoprotein-sorting protein [Candidatus Acidoferrum sp.]
MNPLFAALILSFTLSLPAANTPLLNDAKAGAELAQKVRALAPTENAEFRGEFEFERAKSEDQFVALVSRVLVTNDGWRQIYTAQTPKGAETLSILHRPGKASVYTHELPQREAVSLVGDRATNSFASSDFALLDLGLEFFHWPKQVLLTREMKKGLGCNVLESRPANVGIYSRVVSWIDQESSGVLKAEAYDARGKLLKEFEIRKFDRDAGQVSEMEIRNRQTKGSTRLRFDSGAKLRP